MHVGLHSIKMNLMCLEVSILQSKSFIIVEFFGLFFCDNLLLFSFVEGFSL
jgi:hypothetical protein